MNKAYLLLGSNMGNSKALITEAIELIQSKCGEVITLSSFYTTQAWGNENQPDFLNQVILIHTKISAPGLLNILLDIEKEMGRYRTFKNAPRLIDIDILFFNDDVINLPELTIPHPLMDKRRFVLAPLFELNPAFIHPVLHKSIEQLLIECPDKLDVKKNK
ncbi:MAG: 2-amino-4-hydroxy-6-hydroxymethyldihydropteridine diphosphokinase [Ferruginibacter sp.]